MTKKILSVIYTIAHRDPETSQVFFLRSSDSYVEETITPRPGMMFDSRKRAERELVKIKKNLEARTRVVEQDLNSTSTVYKEFAEAELRRLKIVKPQVVTLDVQFPEV